jgi:DNA-binding NtrC family response regulator
VQHPFSGNVRELRNVLERAALLSDSPLIDAAQIDHALTLGAPRPAARPTAGPPIPSTTSAPGCAPPASPAAAAEPAAPLREAEHAALRAALARHPGNRQALADELGISLRTLYRKLRELESGR